MMDGRKSKYKRYSDKWFTELYLEYESIESILTKFQWTLPISVAEYHRLITRKGIIKGEGRSNTSLAQALYVFWQKALKPDIPLARIYYSIPLSVRRLKSFPAIDTIYRIYKSILSGKTKRLGVGVVVSPEWDNEIVLTAKERFTTAASAKKAGDVTIPFGFTSKKLTFEHSVLRILQREYSSRLALEGELALDEKGRLTEFARELIPNETAPFMELQILDVKVQIAHIILPRELCNLSQASSFAVTGHEFLRLSDLSLNRDIKLRPGMSEVFTSYRDYLNGGMVCESASQLSTLNHSLVIGAES